MREQILNDCLCCGEPADIRESILDGFIVGCWSENHTELVDTEYEIIPHTGVNKPTVIEAIESWNEWNKEMSPYKGRLS